MGLYGGEESVTDAVHFYSNFQLVETLISDAHSGPILRNGTGGWIAGMDMPVCKDASLDGRGCSRFVDLSQIFIRESSGI